MGQLYSSPVGRQPGSLYGHHLRRSFQDQGISAKNANYIIDNRSTSFQKAASTQIRKWENFCLAREVDAHNPSLNDLANYIRFLDKELQTGRGIKKYFATVEYCLSTECKSLIFNSSIRSLLTIVAHNKPTIPMLPEEIWDADKVIFHFIEMPDNIALTNLQLSKKCFLLLMISLGRRNADLLALDVSQQFMKKTKDAFYCAMSKWSKGNREGKNNFMQFIEFHRFDAQPKICPYRVLQDYITRVCAPLTARAGCKNQCDHDMQHQEKTDNVGPPISDNISSLIERCWRYPFWKDEIIEVLDKQVRPNNVAVVKPLEINQEVKVRMNKNDKTNEKDLCYIGNAVCAAGKCLAYLMDMFGLPYGHACSSRNSIEN